MNERARRPALALAGAVFGAVGLLGLLSLFVAGWASGTAAWAGPVAAIGGRWLLLVGLCLMVGAAFVGTVILPTPPPSLRRLVAGAFVAAGVGLALVLVALVGASLNVPLWRVAILRTIPLLVAGVLIAAEWRASYPSVRGIGAIGVAAAAAMLADVGTSHIASSAAAHPEHVETFVHWLHVLAVGTWVGGLAALLVCLPALAGDAVRSAVRRFSTSAGIGIGLVAVTGVIRAVQELGPLGNLVSTDFGRLLVAKSVLLVALAGLGAGQRLVGVPAAPRRLGPLRRIGSVELAIGAVVILLAAALVNVPPPA
jgi:putative copper export protein